MTAPVLILTRRDIASLMRPEDYLGAVEIAACARAAFLWKGFAVSLVSAP